jgi:NhaP-type Na+/H+ or K+/H+ antiporter
LAIRLLRTNVGLFGNRSADKPKGDTMMDLFLRSVLGIVLGAALVFLMVWRRRRRSEH